MNLYRLFRERFPPRRETVFIDEGDGGRFSYADLEQHSARYAGVLSAQGVGRGDRVLVQVEKSPQAVFLYLACLRAGAVFVPLNTGYKKAELDYFVADAEPRLIVCAPQSPLDAAASSGPSARPLTLDGEGAGSLAAAAAVATPHEDIADVDEDALAALLYTSGTTGRPKGAMLTHANLGSNARVLHASWGFTSQDVLLHALPIFHTHGLFVAIHCVLLSGTGMLFLPRFDAGEVTRLLPRASVMMGVPTFYTRLLARADFTAETCRNMRLFVSGSAPLRAETWEAFCQRTGHAILERYGMTETGMNSSNPLHGRRRPGTVGQALPGVEIRVCGADATVLPPGEVGEIEVRGPNVFKGYWRQPEKTQEEFRDDGFFRTGDLGTIDTAGYVTIVGRSKDMIISGGFNVYPKEVEQQIDEIEQVRESAVFGVAHPDFGEGVVAALVAEPGATGTLMPDEVIARLKQNLAAYKVPKAVIVVDELPRNAMGKVEKNRLRARHAGLFDA